MKKKETHPISLSWDLVTLFINGNKKVRYN
jgi:hypothetical protein